MTYQNKPLDLPERQLNPRMSVPDNQYLPTINPSHLLNPSGMQPSMMSPSNNLTELPYPLPPNSDPYAASYMSKNEAPNDFNSSMK